jgi:hypothetical protein
MRRDLKQLVLVVLFLCAGVRLGRSEPGEGVQLGRGWSLSPFVEGDITYDSNVLLRGDNYRREHELDEPAPDEDVYTDLIGGLSLIKEGPDFTMNLRGLAQFRRYDYYTDLGDDTYQQNFSMVAGHPDRLELRLGQQFSHVSDYEFTREESGIREQDMVSMRLIETRTRRTDRFIEDYGASLSKDLHKLQLRGSVGYGRVHFGDDTPIYFPKYDLYDWDEYLGILDIGYQLTDKSSLFFAPSRGWQNSENGLTDSSFSKFRIGIRSFPTVKLNYNIGIGLLLYRGGYENTQVSDIDVDEPVRAEELDQQFMHYDIRTVWSMSRRMDLQIFGRNEMIPTSAFDYNTKRIDQGSVGLVRLLGRRWLTSLGLSYRGDTYTLPVNGIDAFEKLVGLLVTLEYDTRHKWLRVAGRVRYEEFTSNIQEDYEQLRASLSLNLTY